MKKVNSIFLLLLVMILSGCTLANTDTVVVEDSENYLPIRMDFNIYTHAFEEINEDLLYWTWFCDDLGTDYSSCSSFHYGDGFFINSQNINVDDNTINNEEPTREILYDVDLTIYFSSTILPLVIYPVITLRDLESNETIEDSFTGYQIGMGLSISSSTEYKLSDTERMIIKYTINFIEIDALQSVNIMEYNNQNQLLQTTEITETNILDEVTLNESCEYVIIQETYIKDSEPYYVRTILNKSDTSYFSLKFLFGDGFVHNKDIHLVFHD